MASTYINHARIVWPYSWRRCSGCNNCNNNSNNYFNTISLQARTIHSILIDILTLVGAFQIAFDVLLQTSTSLYLTLSIFSFNYVLFLSMFVLHQKVSFFPPMNTWTWIFFKFLNFLFNFFLIRLLNNCFKRLWSDLLWKN